MAQKIMRQSELFMNYRMKWFFVCFLLLASSVSCASDRQDNTDKLLADAVTPTYVASERKGEVVYVCSGPKARRYHTTPRCKGLRKCSGRVLEMSETEAQENGKTPCKMCARRG